MEIEHINVQTELSFKPICERCKQPQSEQIWIFGEEWVCQDCLVDTEYYLITRK